MHRNITCGYLPTRNPPTLGASPESARNRARLENAQARISSLPMEVLGAIFEAGKAQDVQPSELPFELLVSHITQQWRSVAHHTHRLWTSITLDTSRRHNLEVGAGRIRRSGALPLDLIIRMSPSRESRQNDLDRAVAITALIFPEINRWRSIQVWTNWSAGLLYLGTNMPPRAPLLQSWEVYFAVSEAGLALGGTESPSRILMDGAPALTSVLLQGVNTQHNCLPPLATVTTLQVHTPISSLKCDGKAWAELTSLSHLVINNADFDWVSIGPLELAALTTLHLNYLPNLVELLVALTAPLLHTVYLDPVVGEEMLAIATGPSFQSKFPHLRSLTLGLLAHDTTSVVTWERFMRIFSKVTHFTLLRDNTANLLQALCPEQSGSQACLWPDLHKLSLPEGSHAPFLGAMLTQREAFGCPIYEVQLSTSIMTSLGKEGLQNIPSKTNIEECNICETLVGDGYAVKWLDGEEEGEVGGEGGEESDDGSDTSSRYTS